MRRLLLSTLVLAAACRGSMAKIEAVRDALVEDDAKAIAAATSSLPTCTSDKAADTGCLKDIAAGLGSKQGFSPDPLPDHAAAATAAVVLVREGRGDYLAHTESWQADLKSGKGAGHDALRLAVAKKMAEAAPLVGRKIEDDAAARATLAGIAAALPGACPTYALLGNQAPSISIPPELSADNSACVQRDLSRREGPGGGYGEGTFRALEGALALWRETERALRMGLGVTEQGGAKATLEKKLAIIEPATQRSQTRKVETDNNRRALTFIGDVHAEAGVALFKSKDAGKD